MSFSPSWLALRESADHAARDDGLLAAAAAWVAQKAAPSSGTASPLVVDLGCGAGSNIRALRPHLPTATRWRLVDNDATLLAIAGRELDGASETVLADLSAEVADVLRGADLVTAAALFDLVSDEWIDRFVAALPPKAAVYVALSYDGKETWTPPHRDDAPVHRAFLSHQQGDKGFGPSLGPAAAARLVEALRAVGLRVAIADSPWRLTQPQDAELMAALADGVAAAAGEMGVDATNWRAAPRGGCVIGHVDIWAHPAD